MIDMGKTPVKSVSRNLQQNVVKDQQGNPEKEKRRIARKKERRATLILGKLKSKNYGNQFLSNKISCCRNDYGLFHRLLVPIFLPLQHIAYLPSV